jgi:pyruvate,water dikinase
LRLVAEAQALERHTRKRLRDRPGDLQRFEDSLALARRAAPFKEDHNYWLDRMLQAHKRRFVMQVGARLASRNALAEAADIMFLHIKEVSETLSRPGDLRSIVSQRKAEHARWSSLTPPKYLGRMPERSLGTARMHPSERQAIPNVLMGTGACAGKVTGPARIVHSADDFGHVQQGDVLVCASPNPSWVALYAIVAGLVTDSGGILSHAAVVAREFGVPSVVGTGTATRDVRDGQLVEVDGTRGQVRLLSK